MKDLTYSQVKSFKEKLIKFNNYLIKKNKIKKDFDDDYEKHEIKAVKDVKYLSNDFVYEDIRFLFNETNEILSNAIKYYEAKPYEVGYYEVRSNEIDYIDIKPHEIKFCGIEFNETEYNEDYCIENIKSEFEKISHNLVEVHNKGVTYTVDYINNGENLKEISIDLEDTKDKFIAYNDTLPFGILSISSYIDLKKMKVVYSVVDNDKFKVLKRKSKIMIKSLKVSKMSLFLRFLKNPFNIIFNDEALEEGLKEYIELNKDKLNYIWINEHKIWLKEYRKVIDQVRMISGKLPEVKKILKSEKEDEIDPLEWRLRMEKKIMEDNDMDEYFQIIELNKTKEKSKQKACEIDELIMMKEWEIIQGDWMKRFDDYREDISENLDLIKRRLKFLGMSKENITDIKDEILLGSIVAYFFFFFLLLYNFFDIL